MFIYKTIDGTDFLRVYLPNLKTFSTNIKRVKNTSF